MSLYASKNIIDLSPKGFGSPFYFKCPPQAIHCLARVAEVLVFNVALSTNDVFAFALRILVMACFDVICRWGHNSVIVPWCIWKIFPSTIHVVTLKMLRPNYMELNYLFRERIDWKDHYTIHLYSRYVTELMSWCVRSYRLWLFHHHAFLFKSGFPALSM